MDRSPAPPSESARRHVTNRADGSAARGSVTLTPPHMRSLNLEIGRRESAYNVAWSTDNTGTVAGVLGGGGGATCTGSGAEVDWARVPGFEPVILQEPVPNNCRWALGRT